MTRRRIEQLVKKWTKILGLEAWEINVDWTKPAKEDAYATTTRMNTYDRAWIYCDPGFESWTEPFTERTIVHELLHLVTRDLDRVPADLENSIHPEAFRMFERRYDHEIEGVVDRLAVILARLA